MKKTKNEEKLLDQFNTLTEKNQKLQSTYSNLLNSEVKIKYDQENLNDQLNEINKKISLYTNKIDEILKDDSEGNILSNDNLRKKCIEKFSLFFVNREEQNENNIYEFHIEYANTVFHRFVEKDTMTFSDLKKEMKYQIGRSENEFFFCDLNRSIILDEFKIKDFLFPFGKIILKSNIPVIQIIENNSQKEIFIDMEKIEQEKLILEDQKLIQNTMKNNFIQMVKNIISGSIYSFIFLIFLLSWVKGVNDFRDVSNYFLMNFTFKYKKMLTIKYSSGYFMKDIKDFYSNLFGFPPQNSSSLYYDKKFNLFNKNNKNTLNMRFIQKRRVFKDCLIDRMANLSLSGKKCGYYEEDTSNFTKGRFSYNYTIGDSRMKIKGTFMEYDQSGYEKIISLSTPQEFYRDMDTLIENKWVDEDTLSLMVNYNIYSLNNDLFFFFRVLWENQGFYYKRFPAFGLINITGTDDIYAKISVFISFIIIGYKIYELKESSNESLTKKKKESVKKVASKNNYEVSFKERCYNFGFIRIFRENFRSPNFIELLSN